MNKRSRTRTGRRTGNKLGHITLREMGNKVVPSRTRLVKEPRKRWEDVRAKRMQDSVKDKEMATPPRKKERDEAEEEFARHRLHDVFQLSEWEVCRF